MLIADSWYRYLFATVDIEMIHSANHLVNYQGPDILKVIAKIIKMLIIELGIIHKGSIKQNPS